MKTLNIIIATILIGLLGYIYIEKRGSTFYDDSNRYQISFGEIDALPFDSKGTRKVLVKLDRKTGKMWIYEDVLLPNSKEISSGLTQIPEGNDVVSFYDKPKKKITFRN